mmetsp:Transcript_3348/g.8075  ORF Transcript_3348/g.8075 Transcript_3348/m.8075 type:complete len:258 (+) Transcript_3348:1419-2192(+)
MPCATSQSMGRMRSPCSSTVSFLSSSYKDPFSMSSITSSGSFFSFTAPITVVMQGWRRRDMIRISLTKLLYILLRVADLARLVKKLGRIIEPDRLRLPCPSFPRPSPSDPCLYRSTLPGCRFALAPLLVLSSRLAWIWIPPFSPVALSLLFSLSSSFAPSSPLEFPAPSGNDRIFNSPPSNFLCSMLRFREPFRPPDRLLIPDPLPFSTLIACNIVSSRIENIPLLEESFLFAASDVGSTRFTATNEPRNSARMTTP